MSTTINRFGEKLRMLRRGKGLTLAQLAVKLGYSTHTYISEIENGKKQPTLELVLAVADFFDVTTDALLRDALNLP